MILIIDNGSQYTHLIKRTCRDLGYEAEIISNNDDYEEVEKRDVEKFIFSGGPSSVTVSDPGLIKAVIEKELGKPVLGICYGHQLISYLFGGKVDKGSSAEYGLGKVTIDDEDDIFKGVPKEINVWVSHFDEIKELPPGFVSLAHSETCKVEAMKHEEKKIYGVQFHPEVWHTEHGESILKNFLEL